MTDDDGLFVISNAQQPLNDNDYTDTSDRNS